MLHKHFIKRSKNFYKVKILTTLEFNNGSCSVSELEGYSRKELKIISSRIKPLYNNIDKRDNPLYNCLY